MATVTTIADGLPKTVPSQKNNEVGVESVIDFATDLTVGLSGNVVQALNIPKGAQVLDVGLEVLTLDSGGGTIGIGDGSDTSGYLSALAVSAASSATAPVIFRLILDNSSPSPAYSNGKTYSADDTLDLIINTAAMTTAKVRVFASYIIRDSIVA